MTKLRQERFFLGTFSLRPGARRALIAAKDLVAFSCLNGVRAYCGFSSALHPRDDSGLNTWFHVRRKLKSASDRLVMTSQ